jgi:arsenate reductase
MLDGDLVDIPYRVWRDREALTESSYKVLFLCTGNSCRSILAEAILNAVGKGRFDSFSAGSKPAGFVHPQALACLNHNRVPVDHPNSKTWDEFTDTPFDLVVTVCDNAAGETCPIFPGAPHKVHWALPDPALAKGSDAEVAEVFQKVYDALHAHLSEFARLTEAAEGRSVAEIAAELGPPRVDFTIEA